VRLLPRVSAHVHDEHVLGLERLLLARAVDPSTHEGLFAGVDVVIVDVLATGKKKNNTVHRFDQRRVQGQL
jgi:hypothetical protein